MKFLFLAILLISTTAFSATTGTLLITGVIPQKISIEITPVNQVDLEYGTDSTVASVLEKSNSPTGYTIKANSLTGGKLGDVSYLFSYDGGSFITLTSLKTVKTVSSQTHAISHNSNVVVKALGEMSGTYSDTITISIESN
jgi:hypothetical protein